MEAAKFNCCFRKASEFSAMCLFCSTATICDFVVESIACGTGSLRVLPKICARAESQYGQSVRPLEGLDKVDCKLLALLQANDQLGLAELAEKTGLSFSTMSARLRRLVQIGVIDGFHARVAAEKVGFDVLAFVLVAWSDPKVEESFVKKIEQTSSVLECHHIAGEWNYLVKLRVRNISDLEAFLATNIASISGVERTNTMIALSSVKETWVIPVK